MQFSYKTRRLVVFALVVIILALASNEGARHNSRSTLKDPTRRISYPNVPLDLDPRALDLGIQELRATAPDLAPSPKPNLYIAPRPLVTAESYLVANLETGKVSSEYNSYRVFPIASISKLVAALVAIHYMQPTQKITITQSMLDAYGDAGHLALGETYTLHELMYPLLLESSNDAAEAIAQSFGYDSFIIHMNAYVQELGMSSTAFKDASGLNPGNVSNAQDLLILAKYLYSSEMPFLDLSRQPYFGVASTTEHSAHLWKSINPFPYDPHFMGGKTGRTNEAKESMLSLFKYEKDEVTYPVAVIVLRSDFSVREVDSSYLFGQFVKKVNEGKF